MTLGLFSSFVSAIDNRITGMSMHTVKTVKDAMFGRMGRKLGGYVGSQSLSATDARTMAKPFAVQGDFNYTGNSQVGKGIGGALNNIWDSVSNGLQNIFGSGVGKPTALNKQHRGITKHFINLDHRWHINALPPMADNIVDPPPMLTDIELQSRPSAFGSGLVGKKYAKLIMERGVYLCLAPLALDPAPISSFLKSDSGAYEKLKSMYRDAFGSVNIPQYSFEAKLAPERYWKAVCVHGRASLMLLGLGEYDANTLSYFLPDVIAKKLDSRFHNIQSDVFNMGSVGKGSSFGDSIFSMFRGLGANAKELTSGTKMLERRGEIRGVNNSLQDTMLGSNNFPTTGNKKNPYPLSKFGKAANNLAAKAKAAQAKAQKMMDNAQKKYNEVRDAAMKKAQEMDKRLSQAVSNAKESVRGFMGRHGGDIGLALFDNHLSRIGDSLHLPTFGDIGGLGSIFTKSITDLQNYEIADVTALNLLQYVAGIDVQEPGYVKNFPFVTFYCDGPIEKSYNSSSDLGDSEIARVTSQGLYEKMVESFQEGLKNKLGISDGLEAITGGDQEEFWKEWHYHDPNAKGFHLSSQIAIPKVIKGTGLNEQYTATIRAVAVGTDRFSLFRLQWVICQLIPFFIPENSHKGTRVLVPQQPLYCIAFSRGVMNLPRAAIESINIKTDSTYTTTEGIASDLTITLTIVPLLNVATMPKFSRFTTDDSAASVLSAIYNPVSSFNLLATLSGHNTVFTKIPQGLWSYFYGGKAKAFIENMRNITRIASNAYADMTVNTNFNFKRNWMTK